MRPMLVNTKQKVAVLASGLAIATTGFVTDTQAAAAAVDPSVSGADQAAAADPGRGEPRPHLGVVARGTGRGRSSR
jgi:hypothetical protein